MLRPGVTASRLGWSQSPAAIGGPSAEPGGEGEKNKLKAPGVTILKGQASLPKQMPPGLAWRDPRGCAPAGAGSGWEQRGHLLASVRVSAGRGGCGGSAGPVPERSVAEAPEKASTAPRR